MQRIYPITEESCRAHSGKPVLLFLTNGTEIQGMLSRVEGGKLYLNEQPGSGRGDNTIRKKAKVRAKTGTAKKTSAAKNAPAPDFGSPFYEPEPSPYGYGFGAPLAFDLTEIAALFVLI
jgi:hypothetical protein